MLQYVDADCMGVTMRVGGTVGVRGGVVLDLAGCHVEAKVV